MTGRLKMPSKRMFWRGCLATLAISIFALLSAIGWIVWRASDASLPPLAKGLTGSFDEKERQFKRRIEQLYPVGSSRDRLVSDLRSQGFDLHLNPGEFSEAHLSRFIGCGDKRWRITWLADGDALREVTAVHGAFCL